MFKYDKQTAKYAMATLLGTPVQWNAAQYNSPALISISSS